MTVLIRVLVVLGCSAILFGFLAFHFIPYWIILPSMSPEKRAQVDRSAFELEWIDNGFYGIEAGAILLAAALLLFLTRARIAKPDR
jgi:hypothetical protein